MKLFDDYSIVKSNDENRLLIVNGLFISYIYFIDLDIWKKYTPYKYMHYSCHELNTIMDIAKYKDVSKLIRKMDPYFDVLYKEKKKTKDKTILKSVKKILRFFEENSIEDFIKDDKKYKTIYKDC